MKFRICFGLVTVFTAGMMLAADGPSVYQSMKNRERGESMHAIMKMTLIDASGESKERIVETWTMKRDKKNNLSQSVMEFKSPATVKGTRFLQIQQKDRSDDQWIYLPALGRVRRIAATEGHTSFMGSDFTYEDMQLEGNDDAEHTLLREEKFADTDCYVLESRSKADNAAYSKVVSWVAKDSFMPLKVEFYEQGSGDLQKIMTVEGKIEKIDGIYTLPISVMKSVKDGHRTVLEIMSNKSGKLFVEYNTVMNPARFTQNFLLTGK